MRTGVRNINLPDIHIKMTTAAMLMETEQIHWGRDATTEIL